MNVGAHKSKDLTRFRVDLPLRALFEAPTIADMAIVITHYQAAQMGDKTLEQLLTTLEMSATPAFLSNKIDFSNLQN